MEDSETRYLLESSESTASRTFLRHRRYMTNVEVENPEVQENYESLDYDTCINAITQDEERKKDLWSVTHRNNMRTIISVVIGVLTAMVACVIDISIESISYYKFTWVQYFMDKGIKESSTYIPIFFWLATNIIPTIFAAILGSYVEPMAAGSGIPQIKCYLNGVKIPRVVRFKTLVSKTSGVICSVLGGLIVGKEGPMIHSGAVIAAGISQGKSTSFNWDFKVFKYFREDKEKRDFVSAGAAAGVAAAFGAPIGGLLFSLEEGASFWNQRLTWRVFFNAMVASFTLNLVLSAYKGQPGKLASNGLLNLGKFDDLTYQLPELAIFILIAVACGFLGAAFNSLNCRLTIFRLKYIKTPFRKVIEAVFISSLTLLCALIMIYSLQDCRDVDQGLTDLQAQMYCQPGKESAVADLWLRTPEGSVRALFHSPNGAYHWVTLLVFCFVFFFMACVTYGLGVPSGLFVPSLLVGGTVGRLIGVMLGAIFPNQPWVDEGKYALVGAAAMLAGVVRMTLSLTVILMECIGNISFGLPLMMIVIASKNIGDWFNEGLYDIHIHLMKAPLLGWGPPPLGNRIFSVEVMNSNVVKINWIEKVGNIFLTLQKYSHNGFPVVEIDNEHRDRQGARLRGLILRSQLIVLMRNKVFNENLDVWLDDKVNLELFRNNYPRYAKLQDVHLSPEEMNKTIDLRPFMNPAPYTVYASMTLPRIFTMFRALGLRHLIVIDNANLVVGIVTRKDLARFEGLPQIGQRSMA